MAKIPGPAAYERPSAGNLRDPGVRVPAPSAPLGNALATAGAAASDVSDSLLAAENRASLAREAVERARLAGQYEEEAAAELRRLQTEDDLSRQEVADGYGAFLKQKRDEIATRFPGSDVGRLQLTERLEETRAKHAGTAAAAVATTRRALVEDAIGRDLNEIVTMTAGRPSAINEAFDALDRRIADFGGAITPEREQALRAGGREKIAIASIETLLDSNEIEGARAALKTPGMEGILSPETRLKINSRIIKAERVEEEARLAGVRKRAELRGILGREPTQAEAARAAGVAAPSSTRVTLADKIRDFEAAVQRPATESEISKMAGATTGEGSGDFGNALTGRALSILTEDAPAFGAGITNDKEDRRFIAAITQYVQPVSVANPDTGLMETRRPELPPFAVEALRRRGIDPGQIGAMTDAGAVGMPGQQQPGAQPQATSPAPGTAAPAQGAPPPALGAAEAPGGAGAQQPAQPGPAAPQGAADAPQAASVLPTANQLGGRTIYEMSGLATGPFSSAADTLSGMPGVGEFVQAPEMVQARTLIPLLQRDLIRVLQNNPKYAEGERKAIEDEIKIDPQFFETPSRYRNRLIAIDDALEVREQNAIATLAAKDKVGREERIHAMNVLNAVTQFRALLLPPRVKTREEALQLSPGTQFLDPAGNLRTRP